MNTAKGTDYFFRASQRLNELGWQLACGAVILQCVLVALLVYRWQVSTEVKPVELAHATTAALPHSLHAPQLPIPPLATGLNGKAALAKPLDASDRLLFSISQAATAVGVQVSRVKNLPSTDNQPPALVLTMVASYPQQKQFMQRVMQTEPRLVLQKMAAQRLPAPATAVSFETTWVVLPQTPQANAARSNLLVASRDIFTLPQPPRVASFPPVLAPVVPPPEIPPEPNVRFLGRFVSPQGTAKVYVSQAGEEMEAKLGEVLPNGYVVDAFTQDELRLVYPRLGTHVVVPLGAEP